MKPPTLREKTKRGLLWASAEALARTLLQTVVLVVLSRLLTPDDYGVVGAAIIVVGISSIFSQLGVGPAIVQRPELEPRHLDAAFVLSVVFGFVTAALIYAAAPFLAAFFKMDALTPALRAMVVIFPITSLGVVSESLIQRDLRFDLIARAEVVSYFIGFGLVAIAAAWLGWGLWSLVAGQIVQMLVRTAMIFRAHDWRPRLACEGQAVRDLRRFSSGTTLARLANYVATNGDNVVVGRYLGAGALGVYGRAYQLMSQPANLVGNVLEKVLFPAMAKVHDRHDRLAAVYRQGVGLLATVMLPASAMICLLAPEIVHLLLGRQWAGVVFPLQIFSVALLFRTSMKMSNSLIRAKGAVWQMAGCQLVYALATVGFAYAGRAWGIEGVCVGVLGSILLCFVIGAALSLRLVGLTWLQFIADHLPGLLLTAVVSVVGWFAASALRGLPAPPLVVVAGSLAAMLAVAIGCALALPKIFLGPGGPQLLEKARSFLSRKSPPPNATAKAAAPRLEELDVLRGLAAVAVMFFHYTIRYGEVFAPGGPPVPPDLRGHIAVHLFFMISGFVIFMTLSKTRSAFDFIVSRFSRLYPVYWAAVLLTFAVLVLAPLPTGKPGVGQVLANLTMLQFWLRVPSVDGVYWTLALELAFYAVMLALFLAGWLRRIEWFVLPWLLAEIAWAHFNRANDLPKIIEVSLLLRYAHLFLAGILFYRLRAEGPTLARHALLTCCLAAHFWLMGWFAGLFATAFFTAFYALTLGHLKWIAARPLVFLGTISYSLYLVHQNIGFDVMRALAAFPRTAQIAAAALVALSLATLLTFGLERPALRAIRAWSKNRRQLRSTAAPLTALSLAALLSITPLRAETYHVRDRDGDDLKDGRSPEAAWKSLAHACEKIAAGDTVIVHAGVYFGPVVLKQPGTPTQPIRFTTDGVEKNRVVLTGARRAIRQGDITWRSDDAKLGLCSLKVEGRPARVLADETDLFGYASLDELKTFTLASGVPGPARGFAYDEKEQRLYLRLGAKDGSPDPGKHTMKVAPPGGAERGSAAASNFAVVAPQSAHVVLEGFTFETPALCGVFAGSSAVTVRNCWFLGCRTGVAGDGADVSDVTVERCDFSQAPAFADVEDLVARAKNVPAKLPPYYWSVRSSGPVIADYGFALHVGTRWKFLGNYIHDATDGLAHWALAEARDVEIAGNTFERLTDNAIETGDHCGRLDAHGNFLADVFEAFSWNPKNGTPWPGPLTFHHNTVTSTVRGGKLWAALGLPPSCFELKCDDSNWASARMKTVPASPVRIPGTGLTAYNNTVILPTGEFFTFSGLRYRRVEGVRFLNNLVVSRGLTPERYHDAADLSGMEFDGNVTAPGARDAKGPGSRFAGPRGQAVDDAAKLLLSDPPRRNFALRENSPALGRGVMVKDLPGLSTDVGAHARGSDGRHALAGPRLAPPAVSAPAKTQ